MLPALFLLTDLWWNPDSPLAAVRANWKLYAVLALGAAGGIALFWSLILGQGTGGSAGFSLKDFTWYQYLFTQFRVICTYLLNFVLPFNLNADWDFPISHNILEHGAIFYLACCLPWPCSPLRYRRGLRALRLRLFRLPDPAGAYLQHPADSGPDRRSPHVPPHPGLDPGRHRSAAPPAYGAQGAGRSRRGHRARPGLRHPCARRRSGATRSACGRTRSQKSPNKYRPHFQLAFAYYVEGRNDLAVQEFEKTASMQPPTADMLVDWGLAYDGLNQPEKALEKFRQAAAIEPSAHAWTQIAYIYAKQSKWKDALLALDTAEKIDANFPALWMYRGQIMLATNQPSVAIPMFQRALNWTPRRPRRAMDCCRRSACWPAGNHENRRQRPLPDSGRSRRHRNLPAVAFSRSG